jgi:hypothetical protein
MAHRNSLHDLAKRPVADLHQRMPMIRYPVKCMNARVQEK